MAIKNYTSSVPVERSVMLIEHQLSRAGAQTISKWYDENKDLSGISFQIVAAGQIPMIFRLPAKWKECEKLFIREIRRPTPESTKRAKEQAQRTAFKILYDWVMIQVSLIELQQAEVIEVFLPYAYDPGTDKTFFEKLQSTGFKQLQLAGSTKAKD
jgi:hypothetical protein